MDLDSKMELEARHKFKDEEFNLSMSVENDEMLKVQVEDELTGDQWCGKFTANYIEQLTHKTGNFKEFMIFCSMLESGLNKASESIMLELMAYSDLESLRSQKNGINQKKASNTVLHNKRYLIMTYTVEFDRIHYPLSLNYIGKIDLTSLKKLVKKQNEEIRELKWKLQSALKSSKGQSHQDSSYENLMHEKETLLLELEACKQAMSNHGVAKELRILKKVIQSLESDLLKEKSKNQRLILKKTDECKQLAEELENVKSNERNLKVRVKNLNEEISILKRSAHVSPNIKAYSNRWSKKIEKPSSTERRRSSSLERRYTTPSPSGSKRFNPTAYIEEKRRKQRESEESKYRNRSSSSRLNRRSRSTSLDRFTPVHSSQSKERPPSNKQRHSSTRGPFRHRRSSSASSIGSRHSSVDSGSERGFPKKSRKSSSSFIRSGSALQSGKGLRKSVINSALSSGESDMEGATSLKSKAPASRESIKKKRKHRESDGRQNYGKNTTADNENDFENSLDIAEIDARLTALQKFMKSNMDDI